MLIDISGLGVELVGASPDFERIARERWPAFVGGTPPADTLRAEIRYGTRDAAGAAFDPRGMTADAGPGSARFAMSQGRVEIDAEHGARFELFAGLGSLEFDVWTNLLHAAMAWWLPRIGGAMLHAAGIVLDGRAHALVGSAGAGKTTWSALARAGGASVLSDDIVVVRTSPDGAVDALGTPFRSKQWDAERPGRWPLASLLFPRHGAVPALGDVSSLLTRARLAANLPFVQQTLDRDEALAGVVEKLVAHVAARELTFARDGSFLALLRGIEGSR